MSSFRKGLTELRRLLDVKDSIKLAALIDVVDQAWPIADELADEAIKVDELVDELLELHRAHHTEPSPRFCTLACQLAAAL